MGLRSNRVFSVGCVLWLALGAIGLVAGQEPSPPAFVELAQPLRTLDAGVKLRLELGGGIVLELSRL